MTFKRFNGFFAAFALLLAAVSACGEKQDTPSTPQAPEAPTGLKLHSATTTSLTFQWNAMEGATAYVWTLVKGSNQVANGTVPVRNVTVDGLEEGTTYRFSVWSAGAGDTKSAASTLEASTQGSSDPGTDPTIDPGTDYTAYYADFQIPQAEEDGQARAFPGAEGGGMWATGGRGGKVYHVTSLGDSSSEQGTLRYGIERGDRPLTIVFDVAGVIALNSQLQVKKGDLTIAGQTAPGDGICLKNYTFRINASNVIVRFIRCRMGDEKQTEDDAIQVMDHDDDKFQNIIIDHCSVSWCTDECASFYGMKNFSFQWNIVSESLRNSVHGKGAHGYGGIWGGNDASYHHNLLAHHDSRNPRIDHDYVSTQKGPVSIFDNVVYNWSGNTCYGGESSSKNGSDYRKYNFFNNYYKPGPVTPSSHIWLLQPTTSCSNCGGTILPGHFYMDGNVMYGQSAIDADNWMAGTKSPVGVYLAASKVSAIKADTPYSGEYQQSVHSAQLAFERVLAYAGASFARDRIDARIADETRNGTYHYQGSAKTDKDGKPLSSSKLSVKGLIDTQTDVQEDWWKDGWPVYSDNGAEVADADADGMPNWFEEQFGLDKFSAADAAAVALDKNGRYTNLEMYLHYLVRNIVTAQNEGASYMKL